MQSDFLPRKPAPARKPTTTETNISEQPVPFETPDQVRMHDPASDTLDPSTHLADSKPRGSGHRWFNLPWPPNRIEIIVAVCVVLIGIAGVVSYSVLSKPVAAPLAAAKPAKKAAPKPTTVPSTLSGLSVAPEVNERPVVGVMIENSETARPQSGLSQAGVIFEAIAEGGITRFLALYQDQQATNVGPVRSARPYYVQWNEGFRAAYAHVGGSPDALNDIKDWGVQDLNQFYNSAPYHRVSSRPSPHNMYTSIVDLANLATQKGFKSEFTGFVRKTASPSKQPNATAIDFAISSALYNVHYDYNATTNTYARSEGGAPQTDAETNTQLSPNVVVAMVVPMQAGAKTAQGGSYSDYNPIGSGAAYIFQDGTVTSATWNKASNTAQITFTDANGAAVKLNPGQTWISAVTATSKVTYK